MSDENSEDEFKKKYENTRKRIKEFEKKAAIRALKTSDLKTLLTIIINPETSCDTSFDEKLEFELSRIIKFAEYLDKSLINSLIQVNDCIEWDAVDSKFESKRLIQRAKEALKYFE